MVVALAAVTCGRLSRAASVRAGRGQCSASADQYRVQVTEPGLGSVVARGRVGEHSPEVVLEHWGGDAEMLALRSPVTGAVGPSGPLERARVAARTVSYYDLDSLQIAYPDGAELLAGRLELVPSTGRVGAFFAADTGCCAPRSTSCCKRSPRLCGIRRERGYTYGGSTAVGRAFNSSAVWAMSRLSINFEVLRIPRRA
jgi:hypothetical protein